MATQTCFDLNTALENWRNELNAQPQLTPDNRRELEKHLADSIAELRQRGLSEEESFWLAQRRIGRPEKIAEEFDKVDVMHAWRERIFWVWLFIFLWRVSEVIINSVIGIVASPFTKFHFYGTTQVMVSIALSMLPFLIPFVLVVSLARGKFIRQLSGLIRVVENRRRFVTATFGLVLLLFGTRAVSLTMFLDTLKGPQTQGSFIWITNLLLPTIYVVLMGVVLIWLLPGQSQKRQMERPA